MRGASELHKYLKHLS